MTATEIIIAVGGRNRVAELTGAKRNAVTQWYKAGIPSKFWPDLLAEAERLEVASVTVDALRGTHRPRRVQPALDAQPVAA